MPLSLSKSMLSRNWSFISRWCTVPVTWSNLSANVDFPWSICAMMLKFLILRTGTWNQSNSNMFTATNNGQFGENTRKKKSNKRRYLRETMLAGFGGRFDVGAGDLAHDAAAKRGSIWKGGTKAAFGWVESGSGSCCSASWSMEEGALVVMWLLQLSFNG